ncbi:hypothetical protein AB6A40_008471, partial [Gnathostoma spinigerum]
NYFQLCCALAGCTSEDEFELQPTSVLSRLLSGQRIDTVGIIRAYEIYSHLPASVQDELCDKTILPPKNFLQSTSEKSLVERFLVAGTMKDCSLMVSLRLISSDQLAEEDVSSCCRVVHVNKVVHPRAVKEKTKNERLSFACTVKIVDLDPKHPKNIINGYERFVAGVNLLRNSPTLRRPCIL